MKKSLIRMAVLLSAAMLPLGVAKCIQADDGTAAAPSAPAAPLKLEGTFEAPAGDEWKIILPTYVWLSGIEGDVTVRGRTAHLDIGFDKLMDHSDGGFAIYIEARKQKFGFYINPSYMALSADAKPGGVKIEDKLNLWIVEGGGFYEFGKWGEEKPLFLDAYAGLRFWDLHNNFHVKGVGAASSNKLLYDPVIGLRARKYFTEKLFGSVRADIGGFDLGHDTSDFSWSAMPLVGYDFNKYFSAIVGYRELAIEKFTGSSGSKNGADLKFGGVMIGFNFDFFGWMARKKK